MFGSSYTSLGLQIRGSIWKSWQGYVIAPLGQTVKTPCVFTSQRSASRQAENVRAVKKERILTLPFVTNPNTTWSSMNMLFCRFLFFSCCSCCSPTLRLVCFLMFPFPSLYLPPLDFIPLLPVEGAPCLSSSLTCCYYTRFVVGLLSWLAPFQRTSRKRRNQSW